MKYIITDGGDVLLFNDGLTHKQVAASMKMLDKVISAGSVSVHDDGVVNCFGESISLKIKSRKDADAELVGRHLRGYY